MNLDVKQKDLLRDQYTIMTQQVVGFLETVFVNLTKEAKEELRNE